MKHFFTLAILCVFALTIHAENTENVKDTIIKTNNDISDRAFEDGPMESVPKSNFSYNGSSYSFVFSWAKKKNLSPHWTGIGMGFMNYNSPPNSDLKLSKSHNFTFNLIGFNKQISHSNWLLVSGIGAEWSRYHFDENVALTKKDGVTSFEPAPEGMEYKSSKLLVYSITVPLLLEYQSSNFHISGGVVGFLKHYSKSQVKYYVDDVKYVKNKGRDLNIRPIDFKLRLQIGFNNVGIYGYYSPMSMFEKGKGPDLKTYTIGMMIGL